MSLALITGGAKRIGADITKHLAESGWDVIIHYNQSEAEAISLNDYSKSCGRKSYLAKADFTDIREIRKVFSVTDAKVSLLINNASLFLNDHASGLDSVKLGEDFAVNLQAPMVLTSLFADQLPSSESGQVINILDYCVAKAPHNFCSYSVTKAGLAYFTKVAAKQLAPNIRVNGIAIGQVLRHPRQKEESFESAIRNSPLQRNASLSEICRAIDFIYNTRSMTGEIIILDGGMHIGDLPYQ